MGCSLYGELAIGYGSCLVHRNCRGLREQLCRVNIHLLAIQRSFQGNPVGTIGCETTPPGRRFGPRSDPQNRRGGSLLIPGSTMVLLRDHFSVPHHTARYVRYLVLLGWVRVGRGGECERGGRAGWEGENQTPSLPSPRSFTPVAGTWISTTSYR